MEEVSFDNLDNPDNSGTSGSGKFTLPGDWGPKRAFIRQEDKFHPWMSVPGKTFPTTVYYQFGKTTTIVKFGFRNRQLIGKCSIMTVIYVLANTTCIAFLGGLPKGGKPELRASPNNETNNALQANVTHGEPDESSARQTKI